jgi:hypothetical protein
MPRQHRQWLKGHSHNPAGTVVDSDAINCAGPNQTILAFVVGKNYNCVPSTVIDSDIVSPVEFDYYLYGHAGLRGTSKPAHFNVLLDENDFTCVVSLDSTFEHRLTNTLCYDFAFCIQLDWY